ncbi:MAG: DUF3880 domain-containing protein [Desulfovibrio sp.]|jgi:hypothetical protein|nr:DUF3880 domain-containing protein [Desulfovibrio sp.]
MVKELRKVIVPGTGRELLRRELVAAFAGAGFAAEEADPETLNDPRSPNRLEEKLDAPALLFSVNFQGLGDLRRSLDALARAKGRVAVWFVDNPWNILSGVRDKAWRSLPLFVTDDYFTAPLKAAGAAHVFHLPLASCPEIFSPRRTRDEAFPPPTDLAPFVFVGRSAFPGKESFFAGLELPDALARKAGLCGEPGRGDKESAFFSGQRPDLSWWEKELDLDPARFWPGKAARLPALGAETANLRHRFRCLAAAARVGVFAGTGKGLDIFGDPGWENLLPEGARLRPPVDYYARLPGIYAAASFNICPTSLQLPRGLSQRHFDVWTAGGLALSDACPGLSLFPPELTRPVTFNDRRDLEKLAGRLAGGAVREELVRDWRRCLAEAHLYRHRIETLLKCLGSVGR